MISARRYMRGIFILWLAGTAFFFWRLEGRYLLPVARPTGASVPNAGAKTLPMLSLLGQAGPIDLARRGQITLLNFWDPACPCSRFNEAHLRRLQVWSAPRGIRLVTVIECTSDVSPMTADREWQARQVPGFETVADPGSEIARRFGVWAAPGAVIISRDCRIAYVGGFNSGRFCDNDKTAWAKIALDAVVRGHAPAHPTMPFYGCQVVAGSRR